MIITPELEAAAAEFEAKMDELAYNFFNNTRQLELNGAELLAIDRILNYLQDAEERQYDDCTEAERERHIYTDVLAVRSVLARHRAPIQQPAS